MSWLMLQIWSKRLSRELCYSAKLYYRSNKGQYNSKRMPMTRDRYSPFLAMSPITVHISSDMLECLLMCISVWGTPRLKSNTKFFPIVVLVIFHQFYYHKENYVTLYPNGYESKNIEYPLNKNTWWKLVHNNKYVFGKEISQEHSHLREISINALHLHLIQRKKSHKWDSGII